MIQALQIALVVFQCGMFLAALIKMIGHDPKANDWLALAALVPIPVALLEMAK